MQSNQQATRYPPRSGPSASSARDRAVTRWGRRLPPCAGRGSKCQAISAATFREARGRRQVIIVTHNANLVVNTDADQVIVASAGPHRSGDLPEIAYQGGGLEDLGIRREVCEILEGGQEAFVERAKRLRVPLRRDLQAG